MKLKSVESPDKGMAMPPPVVQISLDRTDMQEAFERAHIAVEAGVDWRDGGAEMPPCR
ncbi:MAG: hypothetical protein HY231_25115 [Acidobacteria bacterium]|nr:hypothetical protein [Acidobacteriota bacterium]